MFFSNEINNAQQEVMLTVQVTLREGGNWITMTMVHWDVLHALSTGMIQGIEYCALKLTLATGHSVILDNVLRKRVISGSVLSENNTYWRLGHDRPESK